MREGRQKVHFCPLGPELGLGEGESTRSGYSMCKEGAEGHTTGQRQTRKYDSRAVVDLDLTLLDASSRQGRHAFEKGEQPFHHPQPLGGRGDGG